MPKKTKVVKILKKGPKVEIVETKINKPKMSREKAFEILDQRRLRKLGEGSHRLSEYEKDPSKQEAMRETEKAAEMAALSVFYPLQVPGQRVPSMEAVPTAVAQSHTIYNLSSMSDGGGTYSLVLRITMRSKGKLGYASAYGLGSPTAMSYIDDTNQAAYAANYVYLRGVSTEIIIKNVSPSQILEGKWTWINKTNATTPIGATYDSYASLDAAVNGQMTVSQPAVRGVILKINTSDDNFTAPGNFPPSDDTVFTIWVKNLAAQNYEISIWSNYEAIVVESSKSLIDVEPSRASMEHYQDAIAQKADVLVTKETSVTNPKEANNQFAKDAADLLGGAAAALGNVATGDLMGAAMKIPKIISGGAGLVKRGWNWLKGAWSSIFGKSTRLVYFAQSITLEEVQALEELTGLDDRLKAAYRALYELGVRVEHELVQGSQVPHEVGLSMLVEGKRCKAYEYKREGVATFAEMPMPPDEAFVTCSATPSLYNAVADPAKTESKKKK